MENNKDLPINFTGVTFTDTTFKASLIVTFEAGGGNGTVYEDGKVVEEFCYETVSLGAQSNGELSMNSTTGFIVDATKDDFLGKGMTSSVSIGNGVSGGPNFELTSSNKKGTSVTVTYGISIVPGDFGVASSTNYEVPNKPNIKQKTRGRAGEQSEPTSNNPRSRHYKK